MTVYRGCGLSHDEIKSIENNIGGYIGTEGFLSTSRCRSKGIEFAMNTLMEIEIDKDNLGGEEDNGFADISKESAFSTEQEILFNCMNVFTIKSI